MPDPKTLRKRESARYKPNRLKCLLIAEAPPMDDRYFYFDDVSDKDTLFVEIMKVLFPIGISDYIGARSPEKKRYLLGEFRDKGYWLLDAMEDPLDTALTGQSRRVRYLQRSSDLKERLTELYRQGYLRDCVPIILIKVTVYDAFYDDLKSSQCCVVNKRVPFPGSGQQKEFRRAFDEALHSVCR